MSIYVSREHIWAWYNVFTESEGREQGQGSAQDMVATLQARREELEAKLNDRNRELKLLCIQEAELTGVLPPETPLEPGELPPVFRRRVGTAFTYPENLINNNKLKSKEVCLFRILEGCCSSSENLLLSCLSFPWFRHVCQYYAFKLTTISSMFVHCSLWLYVKVTGKSKYYGIGNFCVWTFMGPKRGWHYN